MATDKISIVIPFYNEEKNVTTVLKEVRHNQPAAEVIAIDDGSSDSTWDLIRANDSVTGIRFLSNRGQSAAVLAGLRQASHPICVMMDGDGQSDPADITKLISRISETGVVFGYREVRKDSLNKRVVSKVANSIRRAVTRDGIRDTGCSLKAFRKEFVGCLPPFNGVHRYMGAFFLANDYKIVEVPVNHRPRTCGVSKYQNLNRAVRGVYDLIGVRWYLKRRVNIRADQ